MKIGLVYPHWRLRQPPGDLSDALSVIGYELARSLARSSEVVIYPRQARSGSPVSTREGVCYHRVPVNFDQVLGVLKVLDRLGIGSASRPFHASGLYYRSYARRVADNLRRRRCDVAHIFTFPQFAPIIREANPDIRMVLHMQDHSLCERDPALSAQRLRHVDLIVACSDFVKQNIQRSFPQVADRCVTIPNGVDVQYLKPSDEAERADHDSPVRLLFVGRVSPEKGVHVLLDAFEMLHRDRLPVVLDVVGPNAVAPSQFVDPLDKDPRLADQKRFFAKPHTYGRFLRTRLSPGAAERVRFLGPVPNRKLLALYAAADVFVFPSLWHEPFGIPAIEAMAVGLPVVATRSGALSEIVGAEQSGLLTEPGDAVNLAQAIRRLLQDADLRRRLGAEARRRAVERFSWEVVSQQLLHEYEQILRSPMAA